ncbi:MAG: ArsR family transcriptional regulator [Phycisphaerales bacterium]|nr:ArsR family transcriptional regulator [Phycisphaerales bacterium]
MKTPRRPRALAPLLSSLAEPTRLRILRLLEAEELSVGEVSRVVQLPQSTVSRHLKVLGDLGWLTRRAAGTATMYQVVHDDLPPDSRALWVAVRPQLSATADAAEDQRRLAVVLADRRLDSQAFFGQVAGEWDAVRTNLFGAGFTARALLSLLPRHWVIADLGCGTGNASELLSPHAERVIAVDQSAPMLKAARKRLAGRRNVEFARGSLDALPLPDASVDAAVCVLVLHHLEHPVTALREAARILRPTRAGGVALVVDMVQHERAEYRQRMGHRHLGFAPSDLRAMMTEAGFVETGVTPVPGDPEARGPGLLAATGRIRGA